MLICGWRSKTWQETAACLMAAGPELLKVLRNLLCHHRITELEGVSDTLQERIDAARSAIRRLNGEGV